MQEPDRTILETDSEARALASRLLRMARSGSLATLEAASRAPFASLTSVATDLDGSPVILVSALSGHTINLNADARASLLLASSGKGDPLAHPRVTLIGRVETLERASADGERARARFLRRHPKAALYADFQDFSFRRLIVERASLNGGFGRAYELTRSDLISEAASVAWLSEREADVIAHMNEDHSDAVALYATALCGAPDGGWVLTGIDPGGLDLMNGDLTCRLVFDRPVVPGEDLRARLVALVKTARTREQAPS